MRISQKMLATALVVSMVAAPLTTFAATSTATSSSSSSTATVAQATAAPAPATETAPAVVTSSTPAGGNVSVAGAKVYSTAAGTSTVKSVPAVVITAPAADLASALSLGKGETAFTSSYDISAAKAPAATAVITSAAESQGAKVVGMFNMNVGKKVGGKFVLADNSVRVQATVVAPVAYQGQDLDLVVVSKGGAWRIEQDMDQNPKTGTFMIDGGLCACGFIAH